MDNFKASGGIYILPFLGLVFVILKLFKVINWSWIWVTCPFWAKSQSTERYQNS